MTKFTTNKKNKKKKRNKKKKKKFYKVITYYDLFVTRKQNLGLYFLGGAVADPGVRLHVYFLIIYIETLLLDYKISGNKYLVHYFIFRGQDWNLGSQ